MNYKGYILFLFLRLLVIQVLLAGLIYGIYTSDTLIMTLGAILLLFAIINLSVFVKRRFVVMDDFFMAVKYRDFSRWFPEDRGPRDIRFLYQGFNEINRTIKEINSKNEAQFVYLQKILEMVDIGIIAYNLDTGDVLWSNDSFSEIIDFPSFKNIRFVENRKPELYNTIFETYHREPQSTTIALQHEELKVLISDTVFQVEDTSFKLIVLQNIDQTLNKNESEAWKKLLSVMTHEIMNSITPISSLAETLAYQLQLTMDLPEDHPLVLEDVHEGVRTIKNRSEGLLKFAKTYRSLSKVTHLNLQRVNVSELFNNIKLLMEPSLNSKGIAISFEPQSKRMALDIDSHLIEQVLINLILNARDALQNKAKEASIQVKALYGSDRNVLIKVYDNGAGIPKSLMENIFIPFFTSKSTGSGIGLSLCKQIMLLHKGKILVQSKENEGTVFTLVF
jgi:signal transduction histidine kinase